MNLEIFRIIIVTVAAVVCVAVKRMEE